MEYFNKFGIIAITAILILEVTASAQTNNFQEEAQEQWAVLGKRANLVVKASENHVIQFCRWDATGMNSPTGSGGVTFTNTDEGIPSIMRSAEESQSSVPGYSFYGSGLSNGECGITIDSVTDADITVWKCLVVEFDRHDASPSADHKSVAINVKNSVAPSPPVITDKSNVHVLVDSKNGQGIQQTFECCAENGIPNPRLSFEFDGRVISEHDVLESVSPSQQHHKVCVTWRNAEFERKDNGKRLKCLSNHLANSDSDLSQTEDYIELNVVYAPELLTVIDRPENKSVFIRLTEENREVRIAYSSNPEPRVTWFVQEGDGFFREVTNGDEFEFSSTEVHESKNTWNGVLLLKSYNIKESKNVFKIKLENQYGSEEIFLVNTDSAPEIVPVPGAKESGFTLYWLIYTIIGLVIVLILVTVYIVLAKRNGWLCYRNKIGRYDAEKQSRSGGAQQQEHSMQEIEDPSTTVYNPLMTAPV